MKEHIARIFDDTDLQKKELRASTVQLHGYKQHTFLTQNDLKVEILKFERDTQMRKIGEANMIKQHLPNLNNNIGAGLII